MEIKIGKKLMIENECIGIRKSLEKIDDLLSEIEKENDDGYESAERTLEEVLEDPFDRINLFEDFNELIKNYFLYKQGL